MSLGYEELFGYLTPAEKEEFKEIRKKVLADKKNVVESAMDTDKKHREYVNLCIKPFEIGAKAYNGTGFYYVCVDPLYNVGVKNFDLMLYCSEMKTAILVECKNRVSNPGKELSDINGKIKAALENKGTLEELVGGLEIRDIEFVFCIPAIDETKVFTGMTALEEKPPIIIWMVDMFNSIIKVDGRFKKHNHPELNKIIESTSWDGPNIMIVSPSLHMGMVLQDVVVLLLRKFKGQEELNISELCETIKSELRNYPNEWIREFATRILDSGKECEIFEVNDSKFKISAGTGIYAVKAVKERYVSYHANKLMREELEAMLTDRVKGRVKEEASAGGTQKSL